MGDELEGVVFNPGIGLRVAVAHQSESGLDRIGNSVGEVPAVLKYVFVSIGSGCSDS